jgi:hypothetical protein
MYASFHNHFPRFSKLHTELHSTRSPTKQRKLNSSSHCWYGCNCVGDLSTKQLFCREITRTSKAEDPFHIDDSYANTNLLECESCMAICTDGAHCTLHCQRTSKFSCCLGTLHDTHTISCFDDGPSTGERSTSNYKWCELSRNHSCKQFTVQNILWMDRWTTGFFKFFTVNEHGCLGKHLLKLRNELYQYLSQERHHSAHVYWLSTHYTLNSLNTLLQGGDNIIRCNDKLKLFNRKAELWHTEVENFYICFLLYINLSRTLTSK